MTEKLLLPQFVPVALIEKACVEARKPSLMMQMAASIAKAAPSPTTESEPSDGPS